MDVQLTNLQQLHDAIKSIWTKISEECLQHLVESMPRRIKAVQKAKGVQPGGVPNKLASECIYIHSYTKQEGAESARRTHSNSFQCTRKSLIWTKVSSYHCMI